MSARKNLRTMAVGAASRTVFGSLLLVPTWALSRAQKSTSDVYLPPAAAAPSPTRENGNRGNTPSSGMSGGETAGIIGGVVAAGIVTALLVHHYEHKLPSTEDLMNNGPKVPQNALMSHLIVDGVIGPNWPVGLDFWIEGPGSVTLDITTAAKVHYHQVLTNDLRGRGITVTRPEGLPDVLQAATYDVEAVPPPGSSEPPLLHLYGMAAGPKAVHSIAIDQVTFGPSAMKINEAARYGFHSHSDFSNVRADFMFTGRKDNRIVMKQEEETQLSPVAQDEHAQGSLAGKGSVGEHLLQIRAWRGNSGDWVVAWSPDVVTLAK